MKECERFYLLLLLLLVPGLGGIQAQNKILQKAKIKGLLEVEGQGQRLPNASVTLLYARDSSIAKSASSGEEGDFVLDGVSRGRYKLYINYLGYKAI